MTQGRGVNSKSMQYANPFCLVLMYRSAMNMVNIGRFRSTEVPATVGVLTGTEERLLELVGRQLNQGRTVRRLEV